MINLGWSLVWLILSPISPNWIRVISMAKCLKTFLEVNLIWEEMPWTLMCLLVQIEQIVLSHDILIPALSSLFKTLPLFCQSMTKHLAKLQCSEVNLCHFGYKLRMFCIPLEGPEQIFWDNRGIVKNVSILDSAISKEQNAINNHSLGLAAGTGILQAFKEHMKASLAELFTSDLKSFMWWTTWMYFAQLLNIWPLDSIRYKCLRYLLQGFNLCP